MNESGQKDNGGEAGDKKLHRPLLCIFLDGLGIAPNTEVNAVSVAKMPNFFRYVREYPVSLLSGATKDVRRRYWALGCGLDDGSELFPKAPLAMADVLFAAGKKWTSISASEQFLGLGFLFDNGKELPMPGEERLCFSSPAPQEALRPLSKEITRAVIYSLKKGDSDLVLASIPLAHEASARGDFKETVNSLQQLDKLLPKMIDVVLALGGLAVIVSPYGNAERTRDLAADWEDREATANPVPIIIIGKEYEGKTIGLADPLDNDLSVLAPAGTLADFAPSILSLIGLEKPEGMSGNSLI